MGPLLTKKSTSLHMLSLGGLVGLTEPSLGVGAEAPHLLVFVAVKFSFEHLLIVLMCRDVDCIGHTVDDAVCGRRWFLPRAAGANVGPPLCVADPVVVVVLVVPYADNAKIVVLVFLLVRLILFLLVLLILFLLVFLCCSGSCGVVWCS